MATTTKAYETVGSLRAALPHLPEDAVIRDRDGSVERRSAVPHLWGTYAPYTVTYEVDTPAPLDPSKVKVGDTVTLMRGKAVHTDEVSQVSHGHSTHLDTVNGRGAYIVDPANAYGWTLTDHQPAPEPEPEWFPGMLVKATADGLENSELWRVMDPQKYGAEQRWIDRHGDPVPDSKVSDVRPLVVIDPAGVDWRGLQAQMSVLVTGSEPFKRAGDILAVVRRELGIEAS